MCNLEWSAEGKCLDLHHWKCRKMCSETLFLKTCFVRTKSYKPLDQLSNRTNKEGVLKPTLCSKYGQFSSIGAIKKNWFKMFTHKKTRNKTLKSLSKTKQWQYFIQIQSNTQFELRSSHNASIYHNSLLSFNICLCKQKSSLWPNMAAQKKFSRRIISKI